MVTTYCQQQVLWLKITVSNVVLVAVSHGIEKDYAYITGFLLVVVTLLHDTIEEFSTHHFLGDQVVKLRFVKHIVKADDVLVLQFGKDLDFILQGDLILLRQLGFGDNLDGKGICSLSVRPFLHNREGTLSKLFFFFLFSLFCLELLFGVQLWCLLFKIVVWRGKRQSENTEVTVCRLVYWYTAAYN